MSAFRTNQSADYPAFIVNAQIGTAPESLIAGFAYSILRTPAYPDSDETVPMSNTETALLASVKSFFESHDWTVDYGGGAALQSFAITRYDETQTDVTPA